MTFPQQSHIFAAAFPYDQVSISLTPWIESGCERWWVLRRAGTALAGSWPHLQAAEAGERGTPMEDSSENGLRRLKPWPAWERGKKWGLVHPRNTHPMGKAGTGRVAVSKDQENRKTLLTAEAVKHIRLGSEGTHISCAGFKDRLHQLCRGLGTGGTIPSGPFPPCSSPLPSE